MFRYIMSQQEQSLYLEGNQTFNHILANNISNQYYLFIDGKNVTYKVECSSTQTVFIEIKQRYSYQLNSVEFIQKLNFTYIPNTTFFKLSLSRTQKKKYFY